MLLALILAQIAAPAAPGPCLTAELAGWEQRGASLDSGHAVTMPAVSRAGVRLVGVPEPKGGDKVFAMRFKVPRAGTYGIALDQKGWIDLYPAPVPPTAFREALTSSAHGHGPACSTIRKIVRYRLTPGSYQLVVSGLAQPQAKIMLVNP